MYANVHAQDKRTYSDIPTKKALKELVAQMPQNVILTSTDAIGPNVGRATTADNLPDGWKFTVTGPNPYTNRKWYATVEKGKNGKPTVK